MPNPVRKLSLWALLVVVSTANATDIINLGEAPSEWTSAPKNTPLGQKALSYFSDSPVPLDEGRILLDSRFRYEHAAQQGLQAGTSWTLRTQVGYETPRFYGIYGVAEFENNWAMNLSDYQSTPPPNGRVVIREPRNNELNQLFLGYEGYNSQFKGGRQLIKLDNGRFVSSSTWNQDDRNLDAIWVNTEIVNHFWLSYIYNWQVNNTLGEYATPTWTTRSISRNHLVNVHYDNVPYGYIGAYYYYLDLGDNITSLLSSGTSVGLFYEGDIELNEDWSLPVRAEYAFQTDNTVTSSALGHFWENYWHAMLGVNYKGYEIGLGFENIGGNGRRSFQFPIGSKHSFNGWADVFRSIPLDGLVDYYLYWEAPLPQDFAFYGALHYFGNENHNDSFGREVDVGISRQFNENVSGLIEFAYYNGLDSASLRYGANVTRVWVSMEFKL